MDKERDSYPSTGLTKEIKAYMKNRRVVEGKSFKKGQGVEGKNMTRRKKNVASF